MTNYKSFILMQNRFDSILFLFFFEKISFYFKLLLFFFINNIRGPTLKATRAQIGPWAIGCASLVYTYQQNTE